MKYEIVLRVMDDHSVRWRSLTLKVGFINSEKGLETLKSNIMQAVRDTPKHHTFPEGKLEVI